MTLIIHKHLVSLNTYAYLRSQELLDYGLTTKRIRTNDYLLQAYTSDKNNQD